MNVGSQVRYKRCPKCGTVVLMSMAICPVCDRHFQTTAGLSNQTQVSTSGWATASPYSYAGAVDASFAPVQPGALVNRQSGRMDYVPVAVAAIGLPWLGMILNHQFSKGLVVFAVSALAVVGWLLAPHDSPLILLSAALVAVAGYVIGLLDVVAIAQRYSRGEDIREWDWF
jgi:uncharacterized OB-fold protein